MKRVRNVLGYLRLVLLTGTMVLVGGAVALADTPTIPTAYPATYVVGSDDQPVMPDGWRVGETYRVGDYTCARVDYWPSGDLCVFDPDPVGDPVAVEPDNQPIERRFLPDGTDVRLVAVATPPPADQPAGDGAATDGDGPNEDEPGWDCRTMGNGVCGPGQVHPAGCYVRSGKRAGVLLRPWDAAMAADPHYRPDGCGTRTARDRAMDQRLNGTVGQLCAGNAQGGVTCWYADQPRPKSANGPAYTP